MTEIGAGSWTIEVSDFEPSIFEIELNPDGSVTGERHANGHDATVRGTWSFTDPVLELNLTSQAGLHPQPVNYKIQVGEDNQGSDDDGHRFTLHKD